MHSYQQSAGLKKAVALTALTAVAAGLIVRTTTRFLPGQAAGTIMFRIADDADERMFLKEGTSFSLKPGSGYKGGIHAAAGGNPPWFRFTDVPPGDYDILETWPPPTSGSQRPYAVKHIVYGADFRTVTAYATDQSRGPAGDAWDGSPWEAVGTLHMDTTETVYVALQPHPTTLTVADAVMLRPKGTSFPSSSRPSSAASIPSSLPISSSPAVSSAQSARQHSSLPMTTSASSRNITAIPLPQDSGWCACTPGPFVNGVGGCTQGPGCTLQLHECLATIPAQCPAASRIVYGPTVYVRDDSQAVRDDYVTQNGASTAFMKGAFRMSDANGPSRGYNDTALVAPRVRTKQGEPGWAQERMPASWIFSSLPAGRYAAYTRWVPSPARTRAATYDLSVARNGSAQTIGTVDVDQTSEPTATAFGTAWAPLYEGTFGPLDTLSVRLHPSEKGETSADAVFLVRLDAAASSTQAPLPPSSFPPPHSPSSPPASSRSAAWQPLPSSAHSSTSSVMPESSASSYGEAFSESPCAWWQNCPPTSSGTASSAVPASSPSPPSSSASTPQSPCQAFGICASSAPSSTPPLPDGSTLYLTYEATYDQLRRTMTDVPVRQCYSIAERRFVDCNALALTPITAPGSACDVVPVDNGWEGTSLKVTKRATKETIEIPVRNPKFCTSFCPYGTCENNRCTEQPKIPIEFRSLWWPTVDASCSAVHAEMVSFYYPNAADYRGALMRYALDWKAKRATAAVLAELAPQGGAQAEYLVDPTDPERIVFTSRPPNILPGNASPTDTPIPGDPISNTYLWEHGGLSNISNITFDPALPLTDAQNWNLRYLSVQHPYRFAYGVPRACTSLTCTAPLGCRYVNDVWQDGCQLSCGELSCPGDAAASSVRGNTPPPSEVPEDDDNAPPFAPTCVPISCAAPSHTCSYVNPDIVDGCQVSCGTLECTKPSTDACETQGNGSEACTACLTDACAEHDDGAALRICETPCRTREPDAEEPSWWQALFFWRW